VFKFNMNVKIKTKPISVTTRLCKGESKLVDKEQVPCLELVSSLLYLEEACTGPDIAQAVEALSGYMQHQTEQYWIAAKNVLCYLWNTRGEHRVQARRWITGGLLMTPATLMTWTLAVLPRASLPAGRRRSDLGKFSQQLPCLLLKLRLSYMAAASPRCGCTS
jgi:hypothetical protein